MQYDFDLVGKIGSMALIRREDADIDYNIFSRLGSELKPGMIWVTSGAAEIGRLAYVGITRAKQNLTITCAKQRMVRGETQYNKVSRFVKEIPRELLSGAVRKEKEHKEPKAATYQQAKQIFRAKPYGMPQKPEKSFGTPGNPASLGYQEGDRVRHMKFGEGTVQNIVQGGRDYEVTVDFDKVGVKKMFASFAKLKKV